MLKTIFDFVLGPPLPRNPGEGPDYQVLQDMGGFGLIPSRIRGVMDL